MNSYSLTHLSDAVLLRDLRALLIRDRELTATLLAHVAEVDDRRLYASAGYSSMFAYCVGELRLSEDAAGRRITAARAARRFPALLSAIAEGRLHLTAVCLIAPHLSDENANELVLAATSRSRVEIQEWLASRFPQTAGVPSTASIRLVARPGSGPVEIETRDQFSLDEHAPAHVKSTTPVTDGERENSPSPVRFIVQVTIEKSTHDKLRHAQALLSHSLSSRDVAEVLDRALDALIEKLETRKLGAAAGGRRSRAPSIHSPRKFGSSSRYIAAHTRRAVWERDRGRCTFVSTSGHRCGERRLLQFDHVEPVARGGKPSVEGLRLRCRAHNLLEAERAFGREFMKRKRELARCNATATGARATGAHATETRTLSAPRGTAADDLTQYVLAGLRGLGCRGEEARRAALFSLSIESGSLEERMRAALGFISRRSIRAGRSAAT
jgi:hypothetical protein